MIYREVIQIAPMERMLTIESRNGYLVAPFDSRTLRNLKLSVPRNSRDMSLFTEFPTDCIVIAETSDNTFVGDKVNVTLNSIEKATHHGTTVQYHVDFESDEVALIRNVLGSGHDPRPFIGRKVLVESTESVFSSFKYVLLAVTCIFVLVNMLSSLWG